MDTEPELLEAADEECLISFCDDGGDDDDDIPDMPSFEASNVEDRPMAPPAEDYPLGCEVELRDIEFAKIAQESSHWEPVMEILFSVPRRRVQVDRHAGDYTFVLSSEIEGFEKMGCTLYRACLSEPKVKATRYHANICSGQPAIDLDDEKGDLLNIPVRGSVHGSTAMELSANLAATRPMLPNSSASAAASAAAAAVVAAVNNRASRNVYNATEEKRRKTFIAYMKKGTSEISKKNFDAALRFYNRALEETPEEEARVRSSRSVAFLMSGDKDRALEDANRVVQLLPRESVGYIRTGNVFRSMRKYVDAQKMYAAALTFEPDSLVVRNLLEGNSVAMLYEWRTKRYPKMRVVFDERKKRAINMSAANLGPDETIVKEASCIMAPLSSLMGKIMAGGLRCPCCIHCGRPFVDVQQIAENIPGMSPSVFRTIYAEREPVPCHSFCNALYCSEHCKTKAWVEHHWVECSQRGRWRDGTHEVHLILDDHAIGTMDNDPVRPYVHHIAEDDRPVMEAACIRLAVRMMARIISSALPSDEAVRCYRWLPLAESVKASRSNVLPLLERCYSALSKSFTSQEEQYLTFDVFRDCYERVKSNGFFVCCSVWPKIIERVNSHLAFINSEDGPKSRQGNGAPMNSSLQKILDAPQHGVPGTFFNCICLLELIALSSPANCKEEAVNPNGIVRTLVESAGSLRLRTTRPVMKKEIISIDWPPYPMPNVNV